MTDKKPTLNSVGKEITTKTAVAIYKALPTELKAEYLTHFQIGHWNDLKDELDAQREHAAMVKYR